MKNQTPQNPKNSVVIFSEKQIRRTWHNQEWWFVIYDVVAALTDSLDPSGYIKDMRRRDEELSKGWGQIATPLPVATAGGLQKINCSNTEGVFRIIRRSAGFVIPLKCSAKLNFNYKQLGAHVNHAQRWIYLKLLQTKIH